MTWLRRLWARYRGEGPELLQALELRVYRRMTGGGCVLLVSCDGGAVHMILDKGRALALCDTILDTLEDAPEAPPVLQ